MQSLINKKNILIFFFYIIIVVKKFAAIVEARMGSSRLPGKIFYKASNKTFLWHLINRIKKVKQINQIILATTTNRNDDVLENFANKNKINCFRGSELNVKKRVLDAAKKFNVKNIVSITADCPVIDINLISQVIDVYKIHKADFVTNSDFRSYQMEWMSQFFQQKFFKNLID